jgi:beta-glucosidase
MFGFDVIHGYRTIFPVPLALAATWDMPLITRMQAAAAQEARAVGIDWTFAPMVDIARDARWGRIVEGAGEDPFLGASVARAQVVGFQGAKVGTPQHLLATVKHFAAYGAAEGGRDYDSVYLPDVLLHNVYFPPYKEGIDAGAAVVMSSYQDLNDIPATGNEFLLRQILRNEWGFKGFVVSDSGAVHDLKVHGFARSPEDAAFRAVDAGVNMEMSMPQLNSTYSPYLAGLVRESKVSIDTIDAAVLPFSLPNFKWGCSIIRMSTNPKLSRS